MKLILCTLAICLSILASVVTLKEVVREESRRTRASLSKTLDEQPGTAGRTDNTSQRLDAINSQLGALNRRMTALEEEMRPFSASTSGDALKTLPGSLQALRKDLAGITASLAKLDNVPTHLTELTTFIDQSFEHLEKTTADTALPEKVAPTLDEMARKIDDIDHYFTPLYAFLGLVYDPAHEDLLVGYPTVDERINEVYQQAVLMRQDIASLREWLTPHKIEHYPPRNKEY